MSLIDAVFLLALIMGIVAIMLLFVILLLINFSRQHLEALGDIYDGISDISEKLK